MSGLTMQTIVGYANGSLGETSKAMRTAIPAHYKTNMMARAIAFGSQKDSQGLLLNQHMGLQPGGTPLAPRAITKITITGCSDRNDTDGGYQRLEGAIKRVVVYPATSTFDLRDGQGMLKGQQDRVLPPSHSQNGTSDFQRDGCSQPKSSHRRFPRAEEQHLAWS